MIKNNGIFIIKFEEKDKNFIENLDWGKLNEGYLKAKNFFDYEEEISPIRICLIYSPEEYLFFSGYTKYEPWMRALAGYHNTIYIFAPSVVEEYTIHKKETTLETLIHEIVHFFYGYSSIKNGLTRLPLWDEGIANYLANKKIEGKIDFKIPTLRHFTDKSSSDYFVGYILINTIMKHFKEEGSKKIIEFLKKVEQLDSEEVLFKKFEEVFGMDIDSLIQLKGGEKL